MPPVFGRRLPIPHSYDNALLALSSTAYIEDRALAFNIMHDHRVSIEREVSFSNYFSNPSNPDLDDLLEALKKYHEERIRTQRSPDYINPSVNANNLINGRLWFRLWFWLRIKKKQPLVRVLDLNGLDKVFEAARDEGYGGKSFDKFPKLLHNPKNPKPDADAIMKWLNDNLEKHSEDEVRDFIAQVLDALNWFSRGNPYQPTWAALWSSFEGMENEPPSRWLEVVGVHKKFETLPRWVILLKYTVKEAGVIARPTQLDGGNYPYHFPSPPQAPLRVGGHPMDLCISPPSTKLLSEVIHNQIPHPIEHWLNAGEKYGKIIPIPTTDISDQRKTHHDLLAGNYGTGVYTWMNSPI